MKKEEEEEERERKSGWAYFGCVWISFILLKTENLLLKTKKKKKNWITVHSPKHCTFALMHCSYPINSAKKKKKKKKQKRKRVSFHPYSNGYFVISASHQFT